MERRSKEEESSDTGSAEFSIIDGIKKLAAYNARAPLDTEEQLLLFLQSWWSRTYNKPLKDPLLLAYTLEELLYEFYDRIERIKAEQERLEQEDVKIEENKEKADLDWAEKMEREEQEAEMRKSGAESNKPKSDPTQNPENIAWMEKQIQESKAIYGETFGEDIDESFED